MAWKLEVHFSDGTSRIDDDDFKTKKEAENAFDEWLDCWDAGGETLMLAGRDYSDARITDYDVWKE